MKIDSSILDNLTSKAQASPRLSMNFDLRNSPEDHSQRMLNAIEPGSPEIIHRHMKSSETITVIRGHVQESYYDDEGVVQEVIDIVPGGPVVAISVPIGKWHSARAIESGTILFPAKTALTSHYVAATC